MPLHVTHRRIARGLAAAVLAGIVAMAPATAALARQGVYGGETKAGDPIVITSDAKAKKITGAVFRIRINGKDDWWAVGERAKARPAPANPDLLPLGALVTTRNGHGRFAARTFIQVKFDPNKVVDIRITGTLQPRKASGTIKATVNNTMTDEVAGSATVKWTAKRAAGRVYGGATAAGLPIVISLDRHGVAAELGLSCYTEQSTPPGRYWSSNEWLTGFSVVNGRFGGAFSLPEQEADGTTTTYQWNLTGRISAMSARGTVAMTVSGAESSGAPWSFVMPATRFTAATG